MIDLLFVFYSFLIVYLETIGYLTYLGRLTRNVAESEVMKRRSLHAQKLFGRLYSESFVGGCRYNSLMARLGKSSKNYSQSIFQGVPGLKLDMYPSFKPVLPVNGLRFTEEFDGQWGSVHSELFQSYRDTIKSRHSMDSVVDFNPAPDSIRMVIGKEYVPSFVRAGRAAAGKRPRSGTRTMLTPKSKSSSEFSFFYIIIFLFSRIYPF